MPIRPDSQPIGPLCGRLLEGMALRGLREERQRDYIRFVQSYAAFIRRSDAIHGAAAFRRDRLEIIARTFRGDALRRACAR